MNKIGVMTFEDGWWGGKWLVNGEHITSAQVSAIDHIMLRKQYVKCEPVEIRGVDYDHEHRYSWDNIDFALKLDTAVGIISVSLREHMQANRRLKNIPIFYNPGEPH